MPPVKKLNVLKSDTLLALQMPLLDSISEHKVMPAPKNIFALERTYLTWTHMAVTVRTGFRSTP